MKENQDILAAAAEGLKEVKALLEKAGQENEETGEQLGKLLQTCREVEEDLKRKEVAFLALLVDTLSELTGNDVVKIIQHPDTGESEYFVFSKGSTIVETTTHRNTDNVLHEDFNVGEKNGAVNFHWMKSRLVKEVQKALKEKPDNLKFSTQRLSEQMDAISKIAAKVLTQTP